MKLIYILLLIVGFSLKSQDLTGRWTNIISNEEIDYMDLNSKNGETYSGSSFDWSGEDSFCKYTFVAKYNAERNVFLGKDNSLIEKTSNHSPVVYRLQYRKDGEYEYLEGIGRIIGYEGSLGEAFQVRYRKITTTPNEPEPEKELTAQEKQKVFHAAKTRTNQRKALINVYSQTIKCKIIDYGEEDGDSISIVFNNKIIAHQLPINNKEIEMEIELEAGAVNTITFIADNLGRVPPNTTYVEIYADNKVFKYTLFTNLSENATIELRYNQE